MPNLLIRFQETGSLHFITFSCYNRLPLLNSNHSYQTFEQELETIRRRYGIYIAGYVLMPEHVHLLLTEPNHATLASAIQVLKQQTSKKLKPPSHSNFWLPRYYDFNVWSSAKQIEKLRYMHRNPVVRGLVTNPEEWPWSSFSHHATGVIGTVEIESKWTASRREANQKSRDLQLPLPPLR